MSTTLIGTGTTADVAKAVGIVCRKPVVECPQPADAASPVFLHRGEYRTQIGQSATYRHHTEDAAEKHGAIEVAGFWDNDRGWTVSVGVDDDAQIEAILKIAGGKTLAAVEAGERRRHEQMVRDMDRHEADRPAREARRAAWNAAVAARVEEYRPLYERAMANCRTKANGKPHGGDVQAVRWAYNDATGEGKEGSYPEDLARGLTRLTRMAEGTYAFA